MMGLLNALSPEDQKKIQNQGMFQGSLAALAAAMMPARNKNEALARGLMGGMGTYNQQANQAQQMAVANQGILSNRERNRLAQEQLRGQLAHQGQQAQYWQGMLALGEKNAESDRIRAEAARTAAGYPPGITTAEMQMLLMGGGKDPRGNWTLNPQGGGMPPGGGGGMPPGGGGAAGGYNLGNLYDNMAPASPGAAQTTAPAPPAPPAPPGTAQTTAPAPAPGILPKSGSQYPEDWTTLPGGGAIRYGTSLPQGGGGSAPSLTLQERSKLATARNMSPSQIQGWLEKKDMSPAMRDALEKLLVESVPGR